MDASSVVSLPSALFGSPSTSSLSGEKNSDQSDRIWKQIEIYKSKVDHQRKRLAGLNADIVQHNLQHVRRAGAPDIAFKESKIETEKHIFIDRLNKKLVTLNTKISQNKELRKKIDEMRQERCRYDVIYTNLEISCQRNTETMALVLEEGKKTLSQETKAISELEALTKQLEENKRCLRLEQADLNKLLEKAKTDNEDEGVKGVPNVLRQSAMLVGNARMFPSRAAADGNEDGEKQEFDDDEALKRVIELTGTSDIDLLIGQLAEKENLHFGLFRRINEIEMEASKNEANISVVNQELARVLGRCSLEDAQTKKELKELGDKRTQLEANICDVDAQTETQLLCWNNFRGSISAVHDALGLSVSDLGVGTDGITEHNVMQYLAAIENKASEITSLGRSPRRDVADADFIDEQDKGGTPLSPAAHSLVKALELPSATAEEYSASDDSDDGERPFSFRELKKNLENTGLPTK